MRAFETVAPGVERAVVPAGYAAILSPEAVAFVAELQRRFGGRRRELLERRAVAQKELEAGGRLDFLPGTAAVRAGGWTVAPVPEALLDRRVEITGPAEPKMIINALNSGASVFMADFEDSLVPTWDNLLEGQAALVEAVRRRLTWTAPDTGKVYRLNDTIAHLLVRPRGWHLPEAHLRVDGEPASGSLFDFGLFFFHNAREQLARGAGPWLYLPKLESHLEARLWNDVFTFAQDALGVPRGSIKATVLIETLPAAFEMDEILFELREHSSGLNCGRWDYIFSFIKKHPAPPAAVLPDRARLTMDKGFLRAYVHLLIKTCHRRGAHAMGGMAAQIPVKDDPAANEAALAKVRADKLRELGDGHDGTWVAHPALVPIAKAIFDDMPGKNQLHRKLEDVYVTRDDLLRIPEGPRTEAGLRHNVRVGVQYMEAWLRGQGCVPLYSLMEDAATAEISRAQVWQQLHHRASLEGLGELTRATLARLMDEELDRFTGGRFPQARALFESLATASSCPEFFTLPAYSQLVEGGA